MRLKNPLRSDKSRALFYGRLRNWSWRYLLPVFGFLLFLVGLNQVLISTDPCLKPIGSGFETESKTCELVPILDMYILISLVGLCVLVLGLKLFGKPAYGLKSLVVIGLLASLLIIAGYRLQLVQFDKIISESPAVIY